MPTVRDIPLSLDLQETVRAQGITDYARLELPVKSAIGELLEAVQGGSLFEPALVYETHRVAEITDSHLTIAGNGIVLRGSLFHGSLAGAEEIAAAVCTIGEKLEKQVTECFAQGEPLKALLLDGIGSAAVESLGSEACHIIEREAALRGYQAGSPMSPGGPRFPLSEQWSLFELVPAADIGVRLSESGVMIPRKSLSMVVGIGQRMSTWTSAESCARCNLSQTCRYRVHS